MSNSVVLIAIMCGLSAGYILSAYFINKVSKIKLLKSILLLNLVFSVITVLALRYIDFYRIISSIIAVDRTPNIKIIIFNYIFALIITIMPSILAGMVVPVIQSFYPISRFAGIYLLYNLGALAGGFFAAFISFRYFGIYNGFYIISIIFVLYIVYILFSEYKEEGIKYVKKTKSKKTEYKNIDISLGLNLLFIFIMGFSSLAFQTLFMRVLAIIVSNTAYSFSTIVLVYISGIVIGSFIARKMILKSRKNLLFILYLLISYVLFINFFLQSLGGLYIYIVRLFSDYYINTILGVFVLSVILLLIPAICINILFIYLTELLSYKKGQESAASYSLFFSTIGSVLGIITATFVFIPSIGISKSLIIIALASIFILYLLSRSTQNLTASIPLTITAILMLFIINIQILPPSIFRTEHREDKLLFYKETSHGNVSVIQDQRSKLLASYVDNSAVIGTAYDAIKTVHLLGFLPLLYNPVPKDILIIGFGMGVTSGVLGTAVENNIYSIEIVPYIFQAAEYFNDHNFGILDNPKLKKIAMDGRIFLNYTDQKFEIISCDPTHPILGSNALYTRQYFELCRDALTENGIMTQYVPIHSISHRSFKSILKSFSSVFDNISIWLSYTHLVILGSNGDIEMDFRNLRNIDTGVRLKMRSFGITDLSSLLSNYICDGDILRKNIDASIPYNTDSRPFVEYDTFFDSEEEFLKNMEFLLKLRTIPYHLMGEANPDRVKMSFKAKNYMIKALMHERVGNIPRAIEEVRKGLEIYSGDAEMNNYLNFLRSQLAPR